MVVLIMLVLGIGALGLVACAGSASTGDGSDNGSSGGGDDGTAAAEDSFMKAYPTAQEAMTAVVQDAVPMGAGTAGLALADVPDSWSFTFFSPGEMQAYTVDMMSGEVAKAPEQ